MIKFCKNTNSNWILVDGDREIYETTTGLGVVMTVDNGGITCLHKIGDLNKMREFKDDFINRIKNVVSDWRVELFDLSGCTEEVVEKIQSTSAMSEKRIKQLIEVIDI